MKKYDTEISVLLGAILFVAIVWFGMALIGRTDGVLW